MNTLTILVSPTFWKDTNWTDSESKSASFPDLHENLTSIFCLNSVFSRRFMKWSATIIVAFLFFNPHELTKIVLQKFYKILLHQIALFGLANWTKKVFPVFPRNTIPGETKGSPLPIFFGTARHFSGIFSPKGGNFFPFDFFAVLRQNGSWKIPKGPPPFSFFRHCEIFFRK